MSPQTTGFRGRSPTAPQLDALLLIELAIREQANLDEHRKARKARTHRDGFTANARALARAEGWQVDDNRVDASVRRLLARGFLVADRGPAELGPVGCSVRLQAAGYAQATADARQYLQAPLRSFELDNVAFDGMAQIQLDFFGKRYVVGCVEGEEDRAIISAHRFEVDAGEVTKAVTGELDVTRAMLMAGILAHERIAELEDARDGVPASDRLVELDHNAPPYVETVQSLDRLIDLVRESNSYREMDAADQERRLTELEAGRRLLCSRLISRATVKAVLVGTLSYLASKFADAPIGEAATWAWTTLKHLVGF